MASQHKASSAKAKKRTYNRKCGFCGHKAEQSKMVRTNNSPNGWVCRRCRDEYNHQKNLAKPKNKPHEREEYLFAFDEAYAIWETEQAYCFDS